MSVYARVPFTQHSLETLPETAPCQRGWTEGLAKRSCNRRVDMIDTGPPQTTLMRVQCAKTSPILQAKSEHHQLYHFTDCTLLPCSVSLFRNM